MNHCTDHFDENEQTLSCGVSDEELEAAASMTNPVAAALSSQKQNEREC